MTASAATFLPSGDALWQIAVGVPIVNPSFRSPKLVSTTLSANYTTGTSLSVTGDMRLSILPYEGATDCEYRGDWIRVGPSTYSGSEGKVEMRRVTAVGVPNLIMTSALDYDYSSGDPVSAWGAITAGGWEFETANVDAGTTGYNRSLNLTDRHWDAGHFFPSHDPFGYDDLYFAQQFFMKSTATGAVLNQTVPNYIGPSPNVYSGSNTLYFRFGGFALCANAGTGSGNSIGLMCTFDDGSHWLSSGAGGWCDQDTDTWTEEALVEAWSYDPVDGGTIISVRAAASGSPQSLFRVDCIYAEHAACTEDYANGFYQLDAIPNQDTLVLEPLHTYSFQRMPNNAVKFVDPTGRGYQEERWRLTCQMEDSTYDDWTALRELMSYQARGSVLNLHTGLPELPPTLQGYLVIPELMKTRWDPALRSFTMIFEEV